MKELRTLTPFGLELVTRKDSIVGFRHVSTVDDGVHFDYIYFKVHPHEQDLSEAHQAALSDFLRLAVDKDLSKPIN